MGSSCLFQLLYVVIKNFRMVEKENQFCSYFVHSLTHVQTAYRKVRTIGGKKVTLNLLTLLCLYFLDYNAAKPRTLSAKCFAVFELLVALFYSHHEFPQYFDQLI